MMRRTAWVAAVFSGAALLRRFPPEVYSFYPKCPVWMYLHLRCPGCGATRALAALLRGDLVGAWHWNALLVALLPVVVLYGVASRGFFQEVPRSRQISSIAIGGLLGLAVAFGVMRNLPGMNF
jgi:hypothetical protein